MAQFILDSSVLGGSGFTFHESMFADRGRSLQITWSNSGLEEDMEIFGYSVRFTRGETEPQEN